MPVEWKKGFQQEVIVEKLKKIRKMKDGEVSFEGLIAFDCFAVLESMVEMPKEIPKNISSILISKGFFDAAQKQELEAKDVLASIKKKVGAYHKQPLKSFTLLTSMSVDANNSLPNFRINECYLSFSSNIPQKYKEAKAELAKNAPTWLLVKEIRKFIIVKATVKAKSDHEAVEKSLDALDLLRGIWNLHINKNLVFSSGGKTKPINQITLGALHTLHEQNGKKATDRLWYEPDFCDDKKSINLSNNSYETLKFTKSVKKYLNKSTYRREIELGIMNYCRALDYRDHNVSFIKLWSVLEFLTNTLSDSYDKTIKRTSFLFYEKGYHRQVLEHLRQYRNKSVHLGLEDGGVKTNIYQLKRYVQEVLYFHLGNKQHFCSFSEACIFLDIPADKELLIKRIKLYQEGLAYFP